MAISPSDSAIFGANFNHPAVAEAFSDRRYVTQMLVVEAALARVLGRQGLIPEEAARQIEAGASRIEVDLAAMGRSTEKAGFPVIELVRQLRDQVGEPAARYVHWGATTQDVLDSARLLQIREALAPLQELLAAVIEQLAGLSQAQRGQIMAGRTHGQQALPITFGYKVASWLAPLARQAFRLQELCPRLFVVQFGAAAGTLAPYGQHGPALYQALAGELGLGMASMPWHTQRDSLVEFGDWLSRLCGSLAKMAQDVILLSQSEVGELREAGGDGQGGSSTLPHKQNPVHSEAILVAARSNAASLSVLHGALIHEHERGTQGLQLEWLHLPQMMALSGAALAKALRISRELQLDPQRMRANIEGAQSLILAERLKFALAQEMEWQQAQELVRQAAQQAMQQGCDLVQIVRERVDLALDWDLLADPAGYLGATQWFIDRVLEEAGRAVAACRDQNLLEGRS